MRLLAQHVLRRALAAMRAARHGGTLLFLPADLAQECLRSGLGGDHLSLTYRFTDAPSRRRFRTLLLKTMATLARIGGERVGSGGTVGWEEFSASGHRELGDLDEGIFEVGHLMAGLSQVDGALVVDQRFEILGFGAEIAGELPPVETVYRAADLEGAQMVPDHPGSFGTRHRSVFRLCAAYPQVMAIVVSQDGQVRFVQQQTGRVVYFNHRAHIAV